MIKLVKNTPLHDWFKESMDGKTMGIFVNSYYHQVVKLLAKRFPPMAFTPDGLIEGFYDRKFIILRKISFSLAYSFILSECGFPIQKNLIIQAVQLLIR